MMKRSHNARLIAVACLAAALTTAWSAPNALANDGRRVASSQSQAASGRVAQRATQLGSRSQPRVDAWGRPTQQLSRDPRFQRHDQRVARRIAAARRQVRHDVQVWNPEARLVSTTFNARLQRTAPADREAGTINTYTVSRIDAWGRFRGHAVVPTEPGRTSSLTIIRGDGTTHQGGRFRATGSVTEVPIGIDLRPGENRMLFTPVNARRPWGESVVPRAREIIVRWNGP